MTKSIEKNSTDVKVVKHPQRLQGIVTSAGKMAKTVTVTIERMVWHKKLHKQYHISKKYLVHDEKSEAKIGDVAVIEKSRPLSARKNFRLVSLVSGTAKVKGAKS